MDHRTAALLDAGTIERDFTRPGIELFTTDHTGRKARASTDPAATIALGYVSRILKNPRVKGRRGPSLRNRHPGDQRPRQEQVTILRHGQADSHGEKGARRFASAYTQPSMAVRRARRRRQNAAARQARKANR